ncbi:glycosyl transferase family 2 [Antricoccus suffuscus]|uniref:4,4'-diaponeurosporenoate glycosyltransferase n=1 Tax=Antricoccus suffuscus TaxID=1629062 RepID=A0A2T1A0X6_9ACTN|nr:glycosyltransferase [Antricoccus suffuscus]PRZ42255.1 glycosyl transferase family 2 [Antricoccus suffuscus]
MPIVEGDMTISKIVVVIPAHNEEDLLESCLVSVRTAALHSSVPVDTIVVADSCTDRTAEIAARFGQVLQVAHRNVGAARRAGFRAVKGPHSIWMATTDADSVVPNDWLSSHMMHAEAGVELLAGTVQVTNWGAFPAEVQRDYERRYRMALPSTRIHGCNLGFDGRRYVSIGEFAPLALHEDVDLVHRFVEAGARVVWSDESPVVTSSRRTSRAPGGFATHLTSLEVVR